MLVLNENKRIGNKSQKIIQLDFWKRTKRKLQPFDWEKNQKPVASFFLPTISLKITLKKEKKKMETATR